jgi:hypothetical protein
MLLGVGCASFQGSGTLSLPYREPVVDFGTPGLQPVQWVSIRVDHDREWNGNPWCFLPDASGEVGCTFPVSWLETMPMQGGNGYLTLHYSSALQACQSALWSVGKLQRPSVTESCARALLQHRWIEDHGYTDGPPPRDQ